MTIQRVTGQDFTKTPIDKAPTPDLGYEMIPKERYISADYMRKEWDRLWTKVWLLGCREDDIPEPGDYHVTSIGPEEILIARQADGSVRAFYNVCLHRGNRIMVGQGHAESFKCRYHHWDYNVDGTFRDIPDRETFPQGAPPCSGLSEVRCDTWNSFVFFSLNPDVEPLLDYLDPLPAHLDPYHFDRMVKIMDVTVEWDCNWKTSVDAFNESYHVQGIHPELLYFLDDYDIQIDCYDRHSRYLVPFVTLSKRVRETTELPHLIKHAMQEAEMDPADFDGQAREVRRALQQWKREHGPRLGLDYSDLNDDQLTDDYHYLIFPNLTLNTHADDLMLFRQRPHPTDPDKMYFDMYLFRLLKAGEERPDPPRNATYKHGEISLGLVVDQDAYNLPGVQRGMHSNGLPGLWIGDQELRIRHFHKVLADYVGE
ncbi:aromatic ring-hydroxylating dioxygenase subunit alpha [Roseibacterium sp. SDUM158016]|uniref:aromatic ring-hydroxylating oxygenase subunit alpha n=1 Tax=Roseicyclus sediminis TaxID=2980997 RepID=UPI0021CFE1AD|nr:aromatic ring-hydroxylating dioxygenase subunit alpha [Roseibacterium sp. SDUM158016]MCU4652095.1 aromatic ring-hydroxylating dioxygenase subunit alpha [Roseibacterium sp. SDUM158016]